MPGYDITSSDFEAFTDTKRMTDIKNVIILQKDYGAYKKSRNPSSIVSIPDTITNLPEVQSISITAYVETLRKCLCRLQKLELLDLSG